MGRTLARVLTAGSALVAALAACSGDDTTAPSSTTVVVDDGSEPTPTTSGAADAQLAERVAATEWTVELEAQVRSEGGGSVASADWTFDPGAVGEGPYGTFASCSGHRRFVGAYSVSLSSIGSFDAATVWTEDTVVGGGTYDAQVQLQRRDEAPIVAEGTVTLDDDLQHGEFAAFDADGTQVEGRFACTGSAPPTPLVVGDPADGVLDSVEVFALLRRADGERVAGLATDGEAVDVACPAVSGGTGSGVGVTGDARLGAITAFDLDVEASTVSVTINGVELVSDDATITITDDGAAGTFAAEVGGGVSIDGAYRCS